jgi:hypothetical protein
MSLELSKSCVVEQQMTNLTKKKLSQPKVGE